jgi:hypothetical protein
MVWMTESSVLKDKLASVRLEGTTQYIKFPVCGCSTCSLGHRGGGMRISQRLAQKGPH